MTVSPMAKALRKRHVLREEMVGPVFAERDTLAALGPSSSLRSSLCSLLSVLSALRERERERERERGPSSSLRSSLFSVLCALCP